MVVNQTVMSAARKVAVSRNIAHLAEAARAPPARVREEEFRQADWKFLTGNGAIRRLLLTFEEVDQAFAGAEGQEVKPLAGECEPLPQGEACDVFVDMYYGYLNAPTIGRNLLGEVQYNWLMSQLKFGEHAIAVMANGEYSFKGSGYVRGGIFDRIQVVQDGNAITFRDLDYHRLSDVYAEGMPAFSEMAIFIIREHYRFDPGGPWKLELLVRRPTGPLTSVFTSFSGDYLIPEQYVERPEPPKVEVKEEPMWVMLWRERSWQIAVLGAGLAFLTLILVFQDWLARHPTLLGRVRLGFLAFTVLFIGWYMLGQLSVVNVLTFTNAVIHEFRWDTFLIDPTMFILWAFVAMTLLLWGRGVYCGWLCPFGALQTFANELGRRLRIPQLNLPQVVHERLWAIKYVILLVLFGISLQSIGAAERYAEVEPFKTAVTLRFQREWGFVIYAALLLLVSTFNCKFYCKYLCPLGAALAIPARLRLFDWLRRRKECGRPCQICASECEIQAVHETGEINANECHYCLDCQVTYYNAYKCPPLVERRKRHERAAKARKSVRRMEEAMGAKAGLEDIPVKVESPARGGRGRSGESGT
jgi:NosR/NirI family nitrous oxide reductase transcriptional regulator